MQDNKKLLDLLLTQEITKEYADKVVALAENNLLGTLDDKLTVYIVQQYRQARTLAEFKTVMRYTINSLKRLYDEI